MDRPILILLDDIIDAIHKIEEYTKGITLNEFLQSDIIQDAVERNIEIIGEVCNHLPNDFITKHNEIEWHKPISMRNRLIHGYFNVDQMLLWNTIKTILPNFKIQIEFLKSQLIP